MTCDVAIIGAGVVAAHTALQLMERGLRVTVIDPAEPGGQQAASYGNAGWLSSHSVLPPASPGVWRQIPQWLLDPLGPLTVRFPYAIKATPWLLNYLRAADSFEKLKQTARTLRSLIADGPALHEVVAQQVGAEDLIDAHSGLIHVFRDRAHFEQTPFGWKVRRELGIELVELDAEALRAKVPYLDAQYRFGIFIPEAGHCKNPGLYVQRIFAHLTQRGLGMVRARALGIRQHNGRLVSVRTTDGDVNCGQVVVAAGVWSGQLAKSLGEHLPLESERGYHAMIRGAGQLKGPDIPLMIEDRKVVINQMDDGVRCAGQVEIAGIDAAPNWQRAEILRRHLQESFPQLPSKNEVGASVDVWLGHRPSTYDGIPVIGASQRCAQVMYACGHGHVGLVGSAKTGILVAQALVGQTPDIDLKPFSIERFR